MGQYADLFEPPVDNDRARAALNLRFGVAAQPDAAAREQALARRYGLPAEAVRLERPEFEARATVDDARPLLEQAPKLRGWLAADIERAKVAHDDLPPLTSLEQAVGRATAWMMGAAPDGGLPGTVGRAGRAVLSGAPAAGAGLYGMAAAPAGLLGASSVEAALLERQRSARAVADSLMPDLSQAGNIERGFYSGLQSLGQNLLTLPLALLPGGQPAALSGMVAQVGGASYGKAREAGAAPLQSTVYGLSDAAIEWWTERGPLAALLGGVKAGAPLWKTLLSTAAKEVPGEQAATILQDLNEWAVVNPDRSFADYLRERPDAALQTLVATVVGVGGQVAVTSGVQRVADRISGFDRQAQFAEQQQQALADLSKLAQSSKLRQRSPEAFAEFAQSLADEQVPELHVSAQALFQSGVTAQEIEAIAGAEVAARFEEALATGGDVVIPTGEFLARAPDSPALPALMEHIRTAPDAMSAAEAKEWMAERGDALQAEVNAALQQTLADDAARTSMQTVRDTFAAQLQAAGRFPEQAKAEAELIARFYAVTGLATGQTAEQVAESYRLRVQSALSEGAAVLDQAAEGLTPAEREANFRKWFGDSKVVDAQGKPLVVYHGTMTPGFDTFKRGEVSPIGGVRFADAQGFYFTDDPGYASDYGTTVMPVYLSLKNPYIVPPDQFDHTYVSAARRAELEAQGYDGVWAKEVEGGRFGEIVAFRPEQIKSAIGNSGAFDPTNPSILKQSPRDLVELRKRESVLSRLLECLAT